jgi:ABC-type phosphate/phosphonate transport system permease subunit
VSKNTDELKMLQREIDGIPDSNTARSAWKALGFVQAAMKGTMDDYTEDFAEFKNDVYNRFLRMENDIRTISGDIKLIQSNTNTTKNIVSQMSTNGNGKKTVDELIPERKWFVDKVLPGLLQTLIISTVAVLVTLVVINIKQIVP